MGDLFDFDELSFCGNIECQSIGIDIKFENCFIYSWELTFILALVRLKNEDWDCHFGSTFYLVLFVVVDFWDYVFMLVPPVIVSLCCIGTIHLFNFRWFLVLVFEQCCG